MMNMFATVVDHLKQQDPTYAIANLCQSDDVTPELIAEAKDMLKLNQCGWLDTPEQRRETLNLCTLLRMEWESKSNQKPATATQRLLENGRLAEAALLLGFAPDPQRVPLLLHILAAMLTAPHIDGIESDMRCLMQGAQ